MPELHDWVDLADDELFARLMNRLGDHLRVADLVLARDTEQGAQRICKVLDG